MYIVAQINFPGDLGHHARTFSGTPSYAASARGASSEYSNIKKECAWWPLGRAAVNMDLFIVQHLHVLDDGEEDVKFIGAYSSPEAAQLAVDRLSAKPAILRCRWRVLD